MRGLLRSSLPEYTLRDSFEWAPSKPSVKNVDGGIVVTIEHDSTVNTHMCAYAEVLVLAFLPTGATHLAGFLWIHLHDGDTGPFCLVFYQFDEASPSSV